MSPLLLSNIISWRTLLFKAMYLSVIWNLTNLSYLVMFLLMLTYTVSLESATGLCKLNLLHGEIILVTRRSTMMLLSLPLLSISLACPLLSTRKSKRCLKETASNVLPKFRLQTFCALLNITAIILLHSFPLSQCRSMTIKMKFSQLTSILHTTCLSWASIHACPFLLSLRRAPHLF